MLKAAVINAGLGNMTMGLETGGFQVVAAYEPDTLAAGVHETNYTVPIYRVPLAEILPERFPEVDLIAGHLDCPRSPSASKRFAREEAESGSPHSFCRLLKTKRPPAFFLTVNTGFLKSKNASSLLDALCEIGYNCSCAVVDVADAVGYPVQEHFGYIVGIRRDLDTTFKAPLSAPLRQEVTAFLQLDKALDPWYFQFPPHFAPPSGAAEHGAVFCWKGTSYAKSDRVQFSPIKPPIVKDANSFRKLTHREIANLKGFPSTYALPCARYKEKLYRSLLHSENVLLIQAIAQALQDTLADSLSAHYARNPYTHLEKLLKDLFQRLILTDKHYTCDFPDASGQSSPDFLICKDGVPTCLIEVKSFGGSALVPAGKVYVACKKFAARKKEEQLILLVANEVENDCKALCRKEFNIEVWDIGNLLYLLQPFPDLEREFVASLSYTVDHITPASPTSLQNEKNDHLLRVLLPSKEQEHTATKEQIDWQKRLADIRPGREDAAKYELFCMDTLKYALGDYLTEWREQKSSNAGLYRFDLCCKIKVGANSDFFDTVKNYFNTKYIVFECKNYREPITQAEIYTTEKYLYEKALRKVAIIVSRMGADDHALQAARGCLRESGKLILCLSDKTLLEMISIKEAAERDPSECLSKLVDDMLLELEK